jgi:hypothetical protein
LTAKLPLPFAPSPQNVVMPNLSLNATMLLTTSAFVLASWPWPPTMIPDWLPTIVLFAITTWLLDG